MFPVRGIVPGVILAVSLTQFAAAGEIGFQPAQTYPVGSNPIWVVTGDFNNDGKRDLAVINHGDPTVGDPGGVSILFGKGDGTFQPAKNIAIGKNCTSAVVGDFDGDGNEDLALLRPGDATESDDGDVTIFSGNGDGTFRQGQVLTPGKNPSSEHFSIVAADLNGDQRLDLVVVNSGDKTFSVLLGNGNGTFQPPVAYPVGVQPRSAFVADLAGSGEKDVVVFGLFSVQPWLANGDGTFRQGSSFANNGVLAGDLNGDKKSDLVVTPFVICLFQPCPPVYPEVRLGNGDGTFQSPQINLGQSVTAAGDFDGDGKLDLAGTANGPQIQILLGNGDGTFQPPIVVSSNGTLAQLLDVNGDSAPDLVTIANNNISLLVNVGTDFSISASALSPSTLSAGQSATSSLTLKLLSNFDNPVSLTCAVQPAQSGAPTCSVSSNSVTFDNSGEATTTLKINVGSIAASRGSSRPLGNRALLWLPVAGFALLGSGVGISRTRGRRVPVTLISACLFIELAMQLACGGGSGPKSTNYSVTVTGQAGVTQHSVTVNVTVQ
jgi:FG-GAP-like repeat